MIEISLEQVLKSMPAFNKLMQTQGINPRASYIIAKASRVLSKEVEIFEKIKNSQVEAIGELNEDGVLQVPKDKMDVFMAGMQEVLDVKVTLEIDVLHIDSFENCDIEPVIFSDLYWLITDIDSTSA